MNDDRIVTPENDLGRLALLDPGRGREPSAMEWIRAKAHIERVIEGSDHPASIASSRSRVTRRVAIAALGVAACGVALPAVLPGGGGTAYASWTPVPLQLTSTQALPQASKCVTFLDQKSDPVEVSPSAVLLAERRGKATLTIMNRGADVVGCLSLAPGTSESSMVLTDAGHPAPGKGATPGATVVNIGSQGSGYDEYSSVKGQVGPDVTGVDVVLTSGTTITASVRNGWWAAWWPGGEGGEVDALSIVVRTADGSKTYRPEDLW